MKSKSESVKEIESPSGLDLNPPPPSPVRLSKRAGILALGIIFAVAALLVYGIISRSKRQLAVGFHPDDSKRLTAATDAGKAFAAQVPGRALIGTKQSAEPGAKSQELRPPGQSTGHQASGGVAQRPYAPTASSVPQAREPTAEEKRLALAYERELQAMDAPTTTQATTGGGFSGNANQPGVGPNNSAAQLTSLLRSSEGSSPAAPTRSAAAADGVSRIRSAGQATGTPEGYEAQNTQDRKEAFLARGRATSAENYLASRRTKPAGPYEIKAGWDIPAVLEQGLNSDLPGEIKALVRENVYDTATGKYLLIPQGARLVGTYDSRVAYGQKGIQVVWNRLIFPDGSSINLDGMIGQDAGGNAGLRHDVDNHYTRLVGFGLLTSMFSASFQLSQSRRGTVFGYPSAAETAGSAVGAQISQLGADITRRNLDIQPTIKVPIGYRFNVRVNRDILFDSPYQPAG